MERQRVMDIYLLSGCGDNSAQGWLCHERVSLGMELSYFKTKLSRLQNGRREESSTMFPLAVMQCEVITPTSCHPELRGM